MSESRKRINEIRNFTPEDFLKFVKQMIEKYPKEDDTGLLHDRIERTNSYHPNEWDEFTKRQFQANFKNTTDEVLDNIEKTIEGQTIYREIIFCQDKKEFDLDNTKIREPIGKSWSYIPETHSFYAKYCPHPNSEIPILIKGKLLDPEGIDIDKTLTLNLNWSRRESEHEITLKDGIKVHVDEICEKNWIGRRHTSSLPIPMIKQCKKIDKEFTN